MKKTTFHLLGLILIFFSCSDAPNDVVIDPELQPYVDKIFLRLIMQDNADIGWEQMI